MTNFNVKIVCVDYNISPGDDYVGVMTERRPIAISLPHLSSLPIGKMYIIKDEGNNASVYPITIYSTDRSLIDNQGSQTISINSGILYIIKNGTGGWGIINTSNSILGTGNVIGPETATNNALVIFDGVSGELLKNSSITTDLSGNLFTFGNINSANISGTNTGNQTITLLGGVTGSGTASFTATVITNANLTGPVTSVGNATTISNASITLGNITGLGSLATQSGIFSGNSSGTNTGNTVLNVMDYGAVGDGVTDDAPAINALISSLSLTSSSKGTTIYVPHNTYRLASPISINRQIILQGDGGSGWRSSTILKPDKNVTGIRIERYNTSADGGAGDWSIIRDLSVQHPANSSTTWHATHVYVVGDIVRAFTNYNYQMVFVCTVAGTSSGTEPGWDLAEEDDVITDGSVTWMATVVSGIRFFARAKVENMYINGTPGNGVHIVASVPNANANGWRLSYSRIDEIGLNGIFVQGGDANAGMADSIDVAGCDLYCIYDSSFLGNTYVGCQVAATGLGSYNSDNFNAANIFLGCYSESGPSPSKIISPAMVFGGLHAAGFTSDSTGARFIGSRLNGRFGVFNGNITNGFIQIDLNSGDNDPGQVMLSSALSITQSYLSGTDLRLKYNHSAGSQGYYRWDLSNLDSVVPISIATTQQTERPQGTVGFGNGITIGPGSGNFRGPRIVSGTDAPTTGYNLAGDFVFNTSTTAGSVLGWRNNVSGTPGTWEIIPVASKSQLMANVTLVVSGVGADYNAARPNAADGGNLSAYPFLTRQAALDALPKNLGQYTATINDSRTTAEAVTVAGFIGQKIKVVGTASSLASLTISGNTAIVELNTFNPGIITANRNSRIDLVSMTISSASVFTDTEHVTTTSLTLTSQLTLTGGGIASISATLINGNFLTTAFRSINCYLTATSCASTALRAQHCNYIGHQITANSCTATPLELINCNYTEPIGNGLTGANAGAPFAVTLSGGGYHVLTGTSLTAASHLDLDGDTVTWTQLGTENYQSGGTFAYWSDSLWVLLGRFRILNNSTLDYDDLIVRDLQYGRFFKQYGADRALPTAIDYSTGAYAEIVAATGTSQTNAVLIGFQQTKIKTCASNGDSVRFFNDVETPGTGYGTHGEIWNTTTNWASLFPPFGKSIIYNGTNLGANASATLSAGSHVNWLTDSNGNWYVST